MDFLKSLRELFKLTIPEIIVKYTLEAQKYETVETKRAGDRYVAARLQTDGFNSYQEFTLSSLLAAGFTYSEAQSYHIDKTKIPFNRRDIAVEFQRAEIIANYIEQNDYYRMLYGMPPKDDIEEIWLDKDVYDKNGIEPKAIHELSHSDLIILEALGELDSIKEKYPDKKYLKYIGKKRIDIVTARLADNFEVLYFPRIQGQESYYRDFIMTYEECREYFLTVIYNRYYGNKYDYYDNFIAFDLLIMTINRLIPNMLIRFKEREFYDVDTLRIFLDAYGIDYNPAFSIQQLRLVCKNLNILLQEKSTNTVFIDVIDLLGYANCTVMKYYLVKQHKMDADGKPIFPYKIEVDEEGNEQSVLDKDNMYDFYFVQTDINNFNIYNSLHDGNKKVSYEELTLNDRYWVEDERLRTKLIESNFNYIETKYIDIDVVYRLQEIVFETCYLTRMVLDNKSTKGIMISMTKLSLADVSIFDTFIMLICLMCKYNHMEPDLLTSPSKILYILGFNFDADLEAIRKDIENSRFLDKQLLSYINKGVFSDINSINNMYAKVVELEALLTRRMNECETIEAYNAYDKLYRTLLYTQLNNDIYKLKDGTIPLQFTDYLKDSNMSLYDYYMSCNTDDDISDTIDYITGKLSRYFQSTQHLNDIKLLNPRQTDAIMKLLSFFKSYTVYMRNVNVIILLDSRYYNTVFHLSKMIFGGKDGIKLVIPDYTFLYTIKDGIKKEKGYLDISNDLKVINREIFLADMISQEQTKIDFRYFMNVNIDIVKRIFIREYDNLYADLSIDKLIDIDVILDRFITNLYRSVYIYTRFQYKFEDNETINNYLSMYSNIYNETEKLSINKDINLNLFNCQFLADFFNYIYIEHKDKLTDNEIEIINRYLNIFDDVNKHYNELNINTDLQLNNIMNHCIDIMYKYITNHYDDFNLGGVEFINQYLSLNPNIINHPIFNTTEHPNTAIDSKLKIESLVPKTYNNHNHKTIINNKNIDINDGFNVSDDISDINSTNLLNSNHQAATGRQVLTDNYGMHDTAVIIRD